MQNEVVPLCVMDFFVHHTKQRNGCGKKLFEHMLKVVYKVYIEPYVVKKLCRYCCTIFVPKLAQCDFQNLPCPESTHAVRELVQLSRNITD